MKRWGILAAALLTAALISSALAAEHDDSHSLCVKAGCTAGEHSHEAVAWTAWPPPEDEADGEEAASLKNTLPTTAGSYYLTEDVVLSETWTVPAGVVELCLNGHVIRPEAGKDFSLAAVSNGAALRITDCNSEGREYRFTKGTGGLWQLAGDGDSGSAEVVSGGVLTGGCGLEGGGVRMSGGTLELYAGSIVGCSACGDFGGGGGVYLESTSSPIFNMYGGAILGCATADKTVGYPTGGGGVLADGGTVSLYGGVIRDCHISRESDGGGGGVLINSSSFFLYGGEIRDCSALDRCGGGIFVCRGTAEIRGGSIQNCLAAVGGGLHSYVDITVSGLTVDNCRAARRSWSLGMPTGSGGGIYCGGKLTISGSAVTNCTASDSGENPTGGNGGGIYCQSAVLSNCSVEDCQAQSGGGVYITGIKKQSEVSSQLEDASVVNCRASGSGGGVWCGGKLTLTGGSIENSHALGGNGGGVCLTGSSGDVSGLSLKDCTASDSGGGVWSSGSLTFFDSSVERCTATEGDGGGVCLTGGTSELSGGSITGSAAGGSGGGVWCGGKLTLTGGSVIGCTASGDDSAGGVFFSGGALTVSGTSVTDCVGTGCGGLDIWSAPKPFALSGAVKITGNAIGSAGGPACNLRLPAGIYPDARELAANASVGFTSDDVQSFVTLALLTDVEQWETHKSCFTSDDAGCIVQGVSAGSGQAAHLVQMIRPHFTAQPTDKTYAVTIYPAFSTDAAYQWYTAAWEENPVSVRIDAGVRNGGSYEAAYRENKNDYVLELVILDVSAGQSFSFSLSGEPGDVLLRGASSRKDENGRYACTVTRSAEDYGWAVMLLFSDSQPFSLEQLSFGQRAVPGTAIAGQTGSTLDTGALKTAGISGWCMCVATVNGTEIVSTAVCVHNWDAGVITPPACTEEGGTLYTCETCGTVRSDDPVPALGHDWGEWFFAPDWAETGTAYRLCVREGCGESEETDQLPLPSDTSVWTAGDRQEPTATENGYQKYTSVEYGPATEILPALGVYTVAWADGEARITGTRVRSCLAVFAAYKNGQLTAVELVPFTLVKEAADGETVVTVTPETFAPGGNDVRIFLLDGGETPWPLCARWPAP